MENKIWMTILIYLLELKKYLWFIIFYSDG